jgi:hypothetical protein
MDAVIDGKLAAREFVVVLNSAVVLGGVPVVG